MIALVITILTATPQLYIAPDAENSEFLMCHRAQPDQLNCFDFKQFHDAVKEKTEKKRTPRLKQGAKEYKL